MTVFHTLQDDLGTGFVTTMGAGLVAGGMREADSSLHHSISSKYV
jgi:hypothetical protein